MFRPSTGFFQGISKVLKNFTLLFFCIMCFNLSSCNEYEGWNFNSGNYLFTTDTK